MQPLTLDTAVLHLGVQAHRSDVKGGDHNTQRKFQMSKIDFNNQQVVLIMHQNGQKK